MSSSPMVFSWNILSVGRSKWNTSSIHLISQKNIFCLSITLQSTVILSQCQLSPGHGRICDLVWCGLDFCFPHSRLHTWGPHKVTHVLCQQEISVSSAPFIASLQLKVAFIIFHYVSARGRVSAQTRWCLWFWCSSFFLMARSILSTHGCLLVLTFPALRPEKRVLTFFDSKLKADWSLNWARV